MSRPWRIENDAYLLQLSYHIHCNPLRAGIVKRLAGCRWSSYNAYAYGHTVPKWLPTDLIWDNFGIQTIYGLFKSDTDVPVPKIHP